MNEWLFLSRIVFLEPYVLSAYECGQSFIKLLEWLGIQLRNSNVSRAARPVIEY